MPNYYALLIGVGDYQHFDISDLTIAVNNVDALYKTLTDPYVCNYPPDHVTVLKTKPKLEDSNKKSGSVNENLPTRANIMNALDEIKQKAQEDDIVIIYFAGHGVYTSEIFLCSYDTNMGNLDNTAIPGGDLRTRLREIKANILIILDTCHAGAASRLPRNYADIFLDQNKQRIVFASCDADQKSYPDANNEFSLFTKHLRDGLVDKAREGRINPRELFEYVYNKVQKERPEQEPQMSAHGFKGLYIQPPLLKSEISIQELSEKGIKNESYIIRSKYSDSIGCALVLALNSDNDALRNDALRMAGFLSDHGYRVVIAPQVDLSKLKTELEEFMELHKNFNKTLFICFIVNNLQTQDKQVVIKGQDVDINFTEKLNQITNDTFICFKITGKLSKKTEIRNKICNKHLVYLHTNKTDFTQGFIWELVLGLVKSLVELKPKSLEEIGRKSNETYDVRASIYKNEFGSNNEETLEYSLWKVTVIDIVKYFFTHDELVQQDHNDVSKYIESLRNILGKTYKRKEEKKPEYWRWFWFINAVKTSSDSKERQEIINIARYLSSIETTAMPEEIPQSLLNEEGAWFNPEKKLDVKCLIKQIRLLQAIKKIKSSITNKNVQEFCSAVSELYESLSSIGQVIQCLERKLLKDKVYGELVKYIIKDDLINCLNNIIEFTRKEDLMPDCVDDLATVYEKIGNLLELGDFPEETQWLARLTRFSREFFDFEEIRRNSNAREKQNKELNQQITELQEKQTTDQAEIAQLQQERDALTQQITDLQNQQKTDQAEIARLQQERDALNKQITDLQNQQKTDQDKIAQLQQERDALNQQITELQEQHETDQAEIARLQQERNELNQRINQLTRHWGFRITAFLQEYPVAIVFLVICLFIAIYLVFFSHH